MAEETDADIDTPTVETQTAEQAEIDEIFGPEIDEPEMPEIDEPDGSGMVVRLRKSIAYILTSPRGSELEAVAKVLDTDAKVRMAASVIARVMAHKCDCCDHAVLTPVARQIHFPQDTQRGRVVALAVRVEAVDIPVPSGMIGIELPGTLCQREAALDITRIGQQLAEKGDGVAVHRVEVG